MRIFWNLLACCWCVPFSPTPFHNNKIVCGNTRFHEPRRKDPLGRIEQLEGATHCTDLWALGAICYILLSGECPFWSPSPYLTFLRIKRGLLTRNPWGIPDDHAWDFVHRLMQVKPTEPFGADCYQVENQKITVAKGYNVLRQHKYFESVIPSQENPIPSLQDLCVRACAELAKQDALDLDLCDKHPPGDGSIAMT